MESRVESPTPVIAATNLNVIYFGLDNDFTIAAPGQDPKDLNLKTNVSNKLTITPKSGEPGEFNLFISDANFTTTRKVKLSVVDK